MTKIGHFGNAFNNSRRKMCKMIIMG